MRRYTARSRRCSSCSLDWPAAELYKLCPECGGETWQSTDPSMSADEALKRRRACEERAQESVAQDAQTRKMYEEFEHYYTQRAIEQFRAELEAL